MPEPPKPIAGVPAVWTPRRPDTERKTRMHDTQQAPPKATPPALPARREPAGPLTVIGRWLIGEVLWALRTFAKYLVSTFVVQMISSLFKTWFFPEELWNIAEELKEGDAADKAKDANPAQAQAIYLFSSGEYTFYKHSLKWEGQEWPCPILKPTVCRLCEWYMDMGDGNAAVCVAVLKVETRADPSFRYMDMVSLKQHLHESLAAARRRATRGQP